MIEKPEMEAFAQKPVGSISAASECDSYWARIQMLSGLAAAYLRETGLAASQVRLVQETRDGKTIYYYAPVS